jgi:DNA-binding FadR family transcriptional regulator
MTAQTPKKQKQSLVEYAFNAILGRIKSGAWDRGLPPQDVLAKTLKVSRTVVREALAMMIARNMIDVRPKIGTTIKPQTEWLVLVPQGMTLPVTDEVRQVLENFMAIYRCTGWHGDNAYIRAEALLQVLPAPKVANE